MHHYKPKIKKLLSHSDKISYIRLSRSENIGPKTFTNLLELYGNIDDAIIQAQNLALRGGKKITIASISESEKEYENTEKYGGQIIAFDEESYSSLLRQIEDYPPLISVIGNIDILNKNNNIAIVGSRNYSASGYNFTRRISGELAKENFIITSGLARGIDSAAHISALDSVNYSTIAVIAGGINNIYPPENNNLYNRIKEYGLIVAEMPYDTIPKSQNFPRRNRIISGLSKALVIMEASLKSGSLITARFALEQNREIFAVPGFPLDPRYEGNNKLIKEGANLLRCGNDIIEHMNSSNYHNLFLNDQEEKFNQPSNPVRYNDVEYEEARNNIPMLLNNMPISIDDLVENTQTPIQIILTIILELELAGKIQRHYGNKISFIYK